MTRPRQRLAALGAAAALTAGATFAVGAAPAAASACLGGAAMIGQPTRTVSGLADAGAIEVRQGCSSKPQLQAVHLPSPHAGDGFGTASVVANINSGINTTTGRLKDKYADLLVGVPNYDVGRARNAGAIAVFLGSSKGFRFSRLLTQNSPGVAGSVQAGAHFGAAIATQFIFDDSDITVRVGAPDLDVSTVKNAGGIVDITFDRHGSIKKSRQLTERSPYVPGPARAGDRFGAALYALSAVGLPGKTVHGHAGAGGVIYAPGTKHARLVTQDSPCMAGVAEAGDHFGAAVAGNWVGAPGEDIGGARNAGIVQHVGDSSTHCYALDRNTPGVPGSVRAGDRFGASLGEEYTVVDDLYGAGFRLLIGVPGDDTAAHDAGTVDVVDEDDEGTQLKITGFRALTDPHPVAGGAFGSAVSTSGGDLVGAPGNAGGRAYLFDLGGSGSSAVTLSATFRQSTGTRSPGYGASFSNSYRT